MRVRVYLRQSLFSLEGEAGHVPARAMVLVGKLLQETEGSLHIQVDTWCDEKGRALEDPPRTLIIPLAKVDNAWIVEG